MSNGFPARYAGRCSKCSNPIEVGQHISWSRREKGKASHINCEAPSAIPSEPETTTQPNYPLPDVSADTLASVIASAVKAYLPQQSSAPTESIDRETIEGMINESLSNLPERITRVEITNTATNTIVSTQEGDHKSMSKLLYFLSKHHHVYLWGEPGSGKSTGAKLAAERLGVQFGYISLNPQTTDSRLMGYMDANRNYHETVFYQCYRDGGIFCIDEMDNASPALLTTLNSALENGHASFPCGMVPRHADFVLVATGNTCGKGANPKFPERRPFDMATSERFSYIEWQYDLALEKAVTLSINPDAQTWLNWVRSVRDYCATAHPKVMVTPRASFKGAEYLKDKLLSLPEIADAVVFKGLDVATKEAILSHTPLSTVKA